MSALARINRRSLAALAVLAMATVALTASGLNSAGNAQSWVELGTRIESGGEGKVTLVDDFTLLNTAANTVYDNGIIGAKASSWREGAGDNTTAEVSVQANYIRGNWNISGSWRDGVVKFTFTGNAVGTDNAKVLQDIVTVCQEVTSEDCPIEEILNGGRVQQSDRRSSAEWLNGGCVSVISYYRSTNRSYPGTGIVEVLLCDAGTGSDVAGGGWTGRDFIQFSVPPTGLLRGSEDTSPYRFYVGGGTLKTSALSVRTKYDGSEPTSTPTPPWPIPTP